MQLPIPSGYEWYNGGMPISDGAGTVFYAGCVRNNNAPEKSPEAFVFAVFKLVNGQPVRVALQRYVNATGLISVDMRTGTGIWSSGEGPHKYADAIPGFVPVVVGQSAPVQTDAALAARVADLEGRLAEALNKANDAVRQAQGAVNAAAYANDKAVQVEKSIREVALSVLNERIAAWASYTDTWLFNTVWDRGVRLLRFKESKGLTAEQLPLNEK